MNIALNLNQTTQHWYKRINRRGRRVSQRLFKIVFPLRTFASSAAPRRSPRLCGEGNWLFHILFFSLLVVAAFIAQMVSNQVEAGRLSQQITFNKHIAPILFANCAACHHTGGAGPFGLIEYQEVKKRARQIVTVTGSRYMPPWLPEPGYGEFAGARRLSGEQIETIRLWVEQGMIEGDRRDLPPALAAPKFDEAWRLGRPDMIVEMPQSYTLPAETTDVFRNFVIPLPITKMRYVKAVELLPGDKRIFHHANILIDRSGASRRRDEQDPEIGFGGMDVAIESDSF